MLVVDDISLPGYADRPNEDAFGHCGDTAWVIDGATGQGPSVIAGEGETDASWLAGRMNAALEDLAREYGPDLPGLLAACQQEVRREFEAKGNFTGDKADIPGAAVTLLHHGGDKVYSAALSDTVLVLKGPHEQVDGWYGDPVHHRADEEMLEVLRSMRLDDSLPVEEIRERLRPVIREQRRRINTEGGHGVFEPVSDFSAHVVCRTWDARQFSHALLMSDGFSALGDKYGRYDYSGLAGAVISRGLAALGAELREIEDGDPECVAIPRYKKSDDATALLMRF